MDDCSTDDTWKILKKIKENKPYIKIIRLLRNSGQHNAILCGFSIAKGDIIVTMDDDLQNPPEEVPKLIAAIQEGFDIAIGAYKNKKHSLVKNIAGRAIDYIQRRIFNLPKNFQLTSFRAIRKIVVDNVVEMNSIFPYITSMLLLHTDKYVNVPVRHDSRYFGKSNYNFLKNLRLAFNLLLNYSSYPLYFVIIFCFTACSLSIGLGSWVLWETLTGNSTIPGWASTLTAISFFNGLILIALVMQSLYLSRLTQQISRSRVSFTVVEMHE